MRRRVLNPCVAVALCLVALSGCLERKEHLTIRPDGSAVIELHYASETVSDIYEGDAVPTQGHGWAVEERRTHDGTKPIELYAVRVVDADTALPSTYAVPGEEERSHALSFPTELWIERRADGTYYHFRRRYEARRWAYINLKKQELIEEPLKDLEGVEHDQITDEQRKRIVRGFAEFEVVKALTFAREAHLNIAPNLPQDWWLNFAADILRIVDEVDYASLIQLSHDAEQEEQTDKFQAEMDRWKVEIKSRIEKSAREQLHYSASQLNQFLARYAEYQTEFAVSEDLNDDEFDIAVTMPGEIVASNAKETYDNTVRWKFVGPQLYDNSIELLVTSVVR